MFYRVLNAEKQRWFFHFSSNFTRIYRETFITFGTLLLQRETKKHILSLVVFTTVLEDSEFLEIDIMVQDSFCSKTFFDASFFSVLPNKLVFVIVCRSGPTICTRTHKYFSLHRGKSVIFSRNTFFFTFVRQARIQCFASILIREKHNDAFLTKIVEQWSPSGTNGNKCRRVRWPIYAWIASTTTTLGEVYKTHLNLGPWGICLESPPFFLPLGPQRAAHLIADWMRSCDESLIPICFHRSNCEANTRTILLRCILL